jgi:hypothetical protein
MSGACRAARKGVKREFPEHTPMQVNGRPGMRSQFPPGPVARRLDAVANARVRA